MSNVIIGVQQSFTVRQGYFVQPIYVHFGVYRVLTVMNKHTLSNLYMFTLSLDKPFLWLEDQSFHR